MTAPAFAKRASQTAQLIALLSDGRWHRMDELNAICFRYSARIHEMRKKGARIEKQTLGGEVYFYRLLPAERLL